MKRFLPLLIVLALVLVWNWPAWEYSKNYGAMPDGATLLRLYPSVADKPFDGITPWVGTAFCFEPAPALRPISAHLFWLCLYFIYDGMPGLATALVAVLSLALCSVVYLLTLRLTRSAFAAMFAGVLSGVVGFDYPYLFSAIPERANWAWFAQLDNSLAAFGLICLALFLHQGKRRWAFAAFLFALCSKELAVVAPVIILAFQWHRIRERKTQVLLGASVAVVVAFLAYRSMVIPSNYDSRVFNQVSAYHDWWIYQFAQRWRLDGWSQRPEYALVYIMDSAGHWLRELSLVAASLWLLRLSARLPQFRALWPAMASFMALYVPMLAMNTVGHRFIIAAPFFCVAVAVAVHGMARVSMAQWKRYAIAPMPSSGLLLKAKTSSAESAR